MGITQTVDRPQRHLYWPCMTRNVRIFIKDGSVCDMNKGTNTLLRTLLGDAFEVNKPFQHLNLDFLGPFPRSKNHKAHVLVVGDNYSKFVILREASTSALVELENKIYQQLLTKYGVQHYRTNFYYPQSNLHVSISF